MGDAVGSGVSVVFTLGFGEGDAFFSVGLAFAVFGFGFGLGDFSGEGDAVARAFKNSARFSSSVCARRAVPMIALSAKAIVRKIRKRSTAAERNRAGHAFNSRKFLLAKTFGVRNHAVCATGADGVGVSFSSRSPRMMAFNFPPSRMSKQVRYIQVRRTISDASAR